MARVDIRFQWNLTAQPGAIRRPVMGPREVFSGFGASLKEISDRERNLFLDTILNFNLKLIHYLKYEQNDAFPLGTLHGHTPADLDSIARRNTPKGERSTKGHSPYSQPGTNIRLLNEPDDEAIHKQPMDRRYPNTLAENMYIGTTYRGTEKSIMSTAIEIDPDKVPYWRYLKFGTSKMVPRNIDLAIMRTPFVQNFIHDGFFNAFKSPQKELIPRIIRKHIPLMEES